MTKTDTYTKIERSLYRNAEDVDLELTDREKEIRNRMMLCVSMRMEKPLISDSELVSFLMGGCGGAARIISRSQAYRDLAMLNRLVGNIQLAAKSWYRYMIVEGAKKAYDVAITQNDAKGAAAALDKIGKYTRCDKEDEGMDYSAMIPPSFEPTDDVTVLEGLEPIANLEQRRRELRSLFKRERASQAVEAQIIDEPKHADASITPDESHNHG